MKNKTRSRTIRLLLADLLVFLFALLIFALFHHVLPRRIGNLYGATKGQETEDFSLRFADLFSADGSVIEKDGFYQDDQIRLNLTTHKENGVTYYVADFYIKHITNLKTAMASDEFATGVADSTLNLSRKAGALLAVSGDYFGIRQNGIVIRNGEVYRKTKAHEVCVLYKNGTMETYSFADFDVEKAIAGGAWQAWDFGPALLDSEGKAVLKFHPGIAGENPRIGIGYFEPGHYCFVAVDGRQNHSRGMTLPEFAELFESLGCKTAYNLDGGHSAAMTYRGELFSSPSKEGGRDISDIVYLAPDQNKENQ